MDIPKDKKVVPIVFDTYLAVIKNSVGSKMFKNLYLDIDGKKVDATQDGYLSCAFFVSSVLTISKLIKEVHATVEGTLRDMKESGWIEIPEPKVGSVLIWGKSNFGEQGGVHSHIGFYIDLDTAISNNSLRDGTPTEHPWTFNGKRKIEAIFWNPKLD